jgi:hypothetical protein
LWRCGWHRIAAAGLVVDFGVGSVPLFGLDSLKALAAMATAAATDG